MIKRRAVVVWYGEGSWGKHGNRKVDDGEGAVSSGGM